MAKFMDVHSACIVQQLREAHEKALAIEADKADKAVHSSRPGWTSGWRGPVRWTGPSKDTVRRIHEHARSPHH